MDKTRNVHLKSLIEDYWKRLEHSCDLSLREVRPVKSEIGRGRVAELEGEKLLARVERSDYVVLLDSSAKSLTTEMFAAWLCKQRDQSRNLVFVIGGHEGLSEALRRRADLTLSLSPLTFTHEMARCLLLEQIYRAFNMIQGFPYHK